MPPAAIYVRVRTRWDATLVSARLRNSDDPVVQAIGWALHPVVDESTPARTVLVMEEGRSTPISIGELPPSKCHVVFRRSWWAPWTWWMPARIEVEVSPIESVQS